MMSCKNCGKPSNVHYTAPGGEFVALCWDCYNDTDIYDNDTRDRKKEEHARLKEEDKCSFDMAYLGYCGDQPERLSWYEERHGNGKGYPLCDHHKKEKCSNPGCDNQAIGQCDATYQFVCGYAYCAECGAHLRCYPKGGK